MKFIYLVMITILMLECASEKNKMQKIQTNVESYLKAHGQLGEGYVFIGITGMDTVTEKEFLDRQLESLSLQLTNKDTRIKKMDSLETVFKKYLEQHPNDEVTTTNLQDIIRGKTALYVQQHKLDSLAATLKPELADNIKFIGFDYSFNAKDGSGVTMRRHFYIKMDENLNVLNAADLQN